MRAERRLTERRGALVDEVAIANWIGDMDRRVANRRVIRLSDVDPLELLRRGSPDLAGVLVRDAASRDEAAPPEAPDPHASAPHRTSAGRAAGIPTATAAQAPTGPAAAADPTQDPDPRADRDRLSRRGLLRASDPDLLPAFRDRAPADPAVAGG